MKTCSTAFLVIAIMITMLTNKWSTKNSLLWQEILMMFLSVPQPLNQFHGTFHGLKITNWFITWHENCPLTRFDLSIKILLVTITFLFWILLCYLLNMSSFCIGSIFRCCFVVTLVFVFVFFLFFILRRYKFLIYKFTNSTMNINS